MKLSLARLLWTAVMLPLAATAACGSSNRDLFIGSDCDKGVCDAGPTLTAPADGGDIEASPGSVPMCPVTTCSLPWATCPSSEFPCSSNLLTDDENCGGCGIRCAGSIYGTASKWSCVGGKCVFGCDLMNQRNCDDDPTNGCEVGVDYDGNNCGDCGIKCPEGTFCNEGSCVDFCAIYNLPDSCGARSCTNLQKDDANCGTCGHACDPKGPNLPALPGGMYYGCVNGLCGRTKCDAPDKADCNGDSSDGCEAQLHTKEHCGGCFDACPEGKTCGLVNGNIYACLCLDDAETYCHGMCVQIADDPDNCGGCDNICPGRNRPHFEVTCTYGACGGQCGANYADCDGLTENGCEANTSIDNRNCGACGNACLPDQVCFQGNCLVAPCDAGGPGDPTK
jgi:hypothetical protein